MSDVDFDGFAERLDQGAPRASAETEAEPLEAGPEPAPEVSVDLDKIKSTLAEIDAMACDALGVDERTFPEYDPSAGEGSKLELMASGLKPAVDKYAAQLPRNPEGVAVLTLLLYAASLARRAGLLEPGEGEGPGETEAVGGADMSDEFEAE